MNFDKNIVFNILQIITTYIVLIVTLRFNEKDTNKKISEERGKFNESNEIAKRQHEEVLNEQKEATRLSIMPYFILKRENVHIYKNNEADDLIIIDLALINKGNGTAISVINKYLKDDIYKSIIIAKTLTYDYSCYIPFDWNSNCAMVNETIIEKICFNAKKIKIETDCEINSDQFDFIIVYKDMRNQKYEQEFFIQFHKSKNGKYEPLLMESYAPQMIQ